MLCEEIDEYQINKYADMKHIAERKYNGVRVIIDTTNGIKMYGRNGTDLTERLIELKLEAQSLPKGIIIDGEVVAYKDGREWLAGAQKRCSTSKISRQHQLKNEIPVFFFAFDIIMFDNMNLMGHHYANRKEILLRIININFKHIKYVETHEVMDAWNLANAHGWEGIIIKNVSSLYYEGTRSWDWIKVKIWRTDTFEVKGYLLSEKRKLKSLALFEAETYSYVGRCGQGMDGLDINALMNLMQPTGETNTDLDTEPIILVAPFKVSIKYYGYADDGKLRNAIFLGVGEGLKPEDDN